MSSEVKLSIVDRRLKLAGERKRKIEELLKPYDREVYNPAMTKLREECAAEGHEAISGTQSMYKICGKCGGTYTGNGK